MVLAIREARKNLKTMDGGPFGACIVKKGRILAISRNLVLKKDATCHTEINAIRIAPKKLKSHDLSGCIIYSTTEPCPMCFSAIHWAGIGKIVYGTGIRDAKKIGFNEVSISAYKLKTLGESKIRLIGGYMMNECSELLKDWNKLPNKIVY